MIALVHAWSRACRNREEGACCRGPGEGCGDGTDKAVAEEAVRSAQWLDITGQQSQQDFLAGWIAGVWG